MFEYEQEIVDELLQESDQFKTLYDRYSRLKAKVRDANLGTLPLDDFSLENLKKGKLLLKDNMAEMIRNYRAAHA